MPRPAGHRASIPRGTARCSYNSKSGTMGRGDHACGGLPPTFGPLTAGSAAPIVHGRRFPVGRSSPLPAPSGIELVAQITEVRSVRCSGILFDLFGTLVAPFRMREHTEAIRECAELLGIGFEECHRSM